MTQYHSVIETKFDTKIICLEKQAVQINCPQEKKCILPGGHKDHRCQWKGLRDGTRCISLWVIKFLLFLI